MIKKNIIANIFGQIWVSLMKLAFVPLYIKLIGIESFGLIGIFTLIQAWFIVLDLGLSPTISREMSRFKSGALSITSIRDILRSIEIIVFVIAVLIGLAVFCAADYFASVFVKDSNLRFDEIVNALIVMGIIASLRFYEGVYHAVLIGLERQVLFNVINALMHTFRSVGALLALVYLTPSIKVFFIWQGISSVLQIIILGVVIYNILPIGDKGARFSLKCLSNIKSFAGGMLAITILSLGLTQADKIILARYINLEKFGYYSLAATIVSALSMISNPILQAVYPRLIGLVSLGKKDSIELLYQSSVHVVTVITASAAITISLFANTIIYLWTGDRTIAENTGPILSVMILGGFIYTINIIPQYCQIAHNLILLPILSNLFSLIIMINLIYLFLPKYGAIGVCWSVIIALIIPFIISTYIMHSSILIGLRLNFYLKCTILPLIGSFIPIYIASRFQSFSDTSLIQMLLFIILTLISSILFSAFMSLRIFKTISHIWKN